MVGKDQQRVLFRSCPQQQGTKDRSSGQVDRLPRLQLGKALAFRLLQGLRQAFKVYHGQRQAIEGQDPLSWLAVQFSIDGSQDLVAAYQSTCSPFFVTRAPISAPDFR